MEVLGRRRSAVGRGVKLEAEETVQRLTMYRNAPAHEMSLDEFEMCAIDRLQGSCHNTPPRPRAPPCTQSILPRAVRPIPNRCPQPTPPIAAARRPVAASYIFSPGLSPVHVSHGAELISPLVLPRFYTAPIPSLPLRPPSRRTRNYHASHPPPHLHSFPARLLRVRTSARPHVRSAEKAGNAQGAGLARGGLQDRGGKHPGQVLAGGEGRGVADEGQLVPLHSPPGLLPQRGAPAVVPAARVGALPLSLRERGGEQHRALHAGAWCVCVYLWCACARAARACCGFACVCCM